MTYEPTGCKGSHDGTSAGDHDVDFTFGTHGEQQMRARVQARLMIMRSRIQDTREGFGQRYAGDLARGPSIEEFNATLPPLAS